MVTTGNADGAFQQARTEPHYPPPLFPAGQENDQGPDRNRKEPEDRPGISAVEQFPAPMAILSKLQGKAFQGQAGDLQPHCLLALFRFPLWSRVLAWRRAAACRSRFLVWHWGGASTTFGREARLPDRWSPALTWERSSSWRSGA